MNRIVLASGNAGKIREIADIFAELEIDIVSQASLGIESPEETEDTFTGNALLKARFAALRSGLPAMADDSGISVDALGGRPGVRSARYAGDDATDEENLDLLLQELVDVPAFTVQPSWCGPTRRRRTLLSRRCGAAGFSMSGAATADLAMTRFSLTPANIRPAPS
jgi:inosine/xanthosine triphosphate pyrophosphatase family protein